jgi:hypothetical protein
MARFGPASRDVPKAIVMSGIAFGKAELAAGAAVRHENVLFRGFTGVKAV